MFEKKLEAGRHILTGKPIPLMRDGEEISDGYARWAREWIEQELRQTA